MQVLSISINGFAAAGDVVIAAILCTILQVSKTGFSKCVVYQSSLSNGHNLHTHATGRTCWSTA